MLAPFFTPIADPVVWSTAVAYCLLALAAMGAVLAVDVTVREVRGRR